MVLYSSKNPYEDSWVKFYEYLGTISVSSHTYEHAPGGRYGFRYELDEENTIKFIECLNPSGGDLWEIVRKEFSGEDAVEKFTKYSEKMISNMPCIVIKDIFHNQS